MKTRTGILLLLLVSSCALVSSVHAQGRIVFANLSTGFEVPQINAPFYDSTGTNRLAGDNYRAALYISPPDAGEASMTLVGAPQPFRVGAGAGYWTRANYPLVIPPGSAFDAQVRFWDTQGGTLLTFEEAAQAGGEVGISKVLRLAANSFGDTYLTGLTSASLIPSTPRITRAAPFVITDVMAVPNGHQLTSLCDQPVGRSRWIVGHLGVSGEVIVSTVGSEIDTLLSIYQRCANSPSLCGLVACNDNLAPGQTASEVRFLAETNVAYAIAVAGVSGTTGMVRVTIALATDLNIRAMPGSVIELSWPADVTNVVLETAVSLPVLDWQVVTNSPVVNSNRFALELDSANASGFYRLRQQLAP